MQIKSIKLSNFGSYESDNIFEFNTNSLKNIVLIGGKNGAGKTTIFNAIRLCLYGNKCFGYKQNNFAYNSYIIKSINEKAKLTRPAKSSIQMNIEIINGRERDEYLITRSWEYNNKVKEYFIVHKNNILLADEEKYNFENYLLDIIPPDLLDLFFFDGENIADYFLSDGGNERIKKAFMTLCGYDIFNIMKTNFQRLALKKNKNTNMNDYISKINELKELKSNIEIIKYNIKTNQNKIEEYDLLIKSLVENAKKKGETTKKEYEDKFNEIKCEEKKRESLNYEIKQLANDIVPFVIIKEKIKELKKQLEIENKKYLFDSAFQFFNNEDVKKVIVDKYHLNIDDVIKDLSTIYDKDSKSILKLSPEQKSLLLIQIQNIIEYDIDYIKRIKNSIGQSIVNVSNIKKEIEKMTIDEHGSLSRIEEFTKSINCLYKENEILNNNLVIANSDYNTLLNKIEKIKSEIVVDLKNESINEIAIKSIIFIDEIEESLYDKQIKKMRNYFLQEKDLLISKENFIEDIDIDDNFNISIYKRIEVKSNELKTIFSENDNKGILEILGEKTLSDIQAISHSKKNERIIEYLDKRKSINILKRIDKSMLSNGEKQVFTMCLYYALVKLSQKKVPFIIDTPFARIDANNRKNISLNFFKRLNGQVFILSTDEEIDEKHLRLLKDKVANKFLLENSRNIRFVININNILRAKMLFKIKTSQKTMEIFEQVGRSEFLQPYCLSKISITLSLKQDKKLTDEDFKTDNLGLELNRQTITGEFDTLIKSLIEINEGMYIDESVYLQKYLKSHIDRGAKILLSEFKYNRDLILGLINNVEREL